MNSIEIKAHAKLNLSLEIVGRRGDGYHNIVSLMQGIDLHDMIEIKKCAGNGTKYNLPHCIINEHVVYLCTDEKTIPTDMNNLALRAVAAFSRGGHTKLPDCDLMIKIEKNLPVAAGIAGGSGNAAAVMLGLDAMYEYPYSLRDLMGIGVKIGADVPFSIFMNAYRNRELLEGLPGLAEASDAAWIGGIGEKVKAAEAVPRFVIMANPGISVSTAEAYEAIDNILGTNQEETSEHRMFINDLEQYTLKAYSETASLWQIMKDKLDADEVLMSGSGPTIAAYYIDEARAKSDAQLLADELEDSPNCRIWLTSTGI